MIASFPFMKVYKASYLKELLDISHYCSFLSLMKGPRPREAKRCPNHMSCFLFSS